MKFKKLIMINSVLFLSACSHHIQTTSGADYLKRYSENSSYSNLQKTNPDIYDIASIEPSLSFPARIGIARINGNSLTSIPQGESAIWTDLAEKQGQRYGEFIPVSPFITAMVSTEYKDKTHVKNIISNIRKGAARQHLDYVLVYEVSSRNTRRKNGLGFTDATVLGLFLFPSRKIEVDTIASAVLLDVRNGYPYMTASSFSDKKSTTTRYNSSSKQEKLAEIGRITAVENLSVDIEEGLQELKDAAYAKLVAEGY